MLTLAVAVAMAQEPARLITGSPEFASCLESAACLDPFTAFLSVSMAEQGFTLTGDALAASPTVDAAAGLSVGVSWATFPFSAPRENLSGKPENTAFSPVLPRLAAGVGSTNEGGPRFGAGLTLTPPLPVGGASAWVVGGELGASWLIVEQLRLGAEVTVGTTRARAPVVATREQFESRDDWANPDNLDPERWEAVCGSQPHGCIDTYTLFDATPRLVVAYDPVPVVVLYGKLGLSWVSERLSVEYDGTKWGIDGFQPNVHAGVGVRPGRFTVVLGAGMAPKPAGYGGDGPVFFKLDGAVMYRFEPLR